MSKDFSLASIVLFVLRRQFKLIALLNIFILSGFTTLWLLSPSSFSVSVGFNCGSTESVRYNVSCSSWREVSGELAQARAFVHSAMRPVHAGFFARQFDSKDQTSLRFFEGFSAEYSAESIDFSWRGFDHSIWSEREAAELLVDFATFTYGAVDELVANRYADFFRACVISRVNGSPCLHESLLMSKSSFATCTVGPLCSGVRGFPVATPAVRYVESGDLERFHLIQLVFIWLLANLMFFLFCLAKFEDQSSVGYRDFFRGDS